MPALSSFKARMYSWVKSLSLGHFPKSWRENKGRDMETQPKGGLEKGDVTHELTPLMILWGRVLARAACSHLIDLLAGRGHSSRLDVSLSGRCSTWPLVTPAIYKLF